jgi:hypothetical protein
MYKFESTYITLELLILALSKFVQGSELDKKDVKRMQNHRDTYSYHIWFFGFISSVLLESEVVQI